MARIDIARLRKENGMSQQQLAEHLQVNQSFLSAIERGRSPLPADKEARLKEIFGLESLDSYLLLNDETISAGDLMKDDVIGRIIGYFHNRAHQELDNGLPRHSAETDKSHEERHRQAHQEIDKFFEALKSRNDMLESRNSFLMERNETLNQKIISLLEEVDNLRKENFSLREKLIRAGVE